MQKRAKYEQFQSKLPWIESPVPLPDEFPVFCPSRYIQPDNPITYLHRHDSTEIGYCHRGQGIWIIGDRIIPFGPGDFSVITHEEPHLAQSLNGTISEWTWVYCDPQMLFMPGTRYGKSPDIERLRGCGFGNIFKSAGHPFESLVVKEIVAECEKGKKNLRKDILYGLFYTLFAMLQRTIVVSEKSDGTVTKGRRKDLAAVAPAVEYILNNYHQTCNVPQLARLCHMSEATFRRAFGRAMQKSPKEYLNTIRLSMVCLELQSGKASISEVALRNGFDTLSAFNRLFREKMGMTPREWRRGAAL